MNGSGEMVVGTPRRQRLRWMRGLGRVAFFVVGGVQCLLGVMFGVGLVASAFIYAGDGPGSLATNVLLLIVDLLLLAVGLIAVLSALEEWEPPHNRWQGVRWPVLGLGGSVITLVSWGVAAIVVWRG
jgi:hypothetical protein